MSLRDKMRSACVVFLGEDVVQALENADVSEPRMWSMAVEQAFLALVEEVHKNPSYVRSSVTWTWAEVLYRGMEKLRKDGFIGPEDE